jgi:hypothetical protein
VAPVAAVSEQQAAVGKEVLVVAATDTTAPSVLQQLDVQAVTATEDPPLTRYSSIKRIQI